MEISIKPDFGLNPAKTIGAKRWKECTFDKFLHNWPVQLFLSLLFLGLSHALVHSIASQNALFYRKGTVLNLLMA